MDPLSLQQLQRNAYRILGLPAGATQVEVNAAARMMLLLGADGDREHADWLGTIDRRPAEIEGALTRLADPRERLRQRIWWFWGSIPASSEQAEHLRTAVASISNEIVEHDALILNLASHLQFDGNHELHSWEEPLAAAAGLACKEASLQWLARAEADGDFEKRATEDEIAATHQAIAEQTAMTLAHLGDDALGCDDLASLAIVLEILDGVESFGTCATDWLMDRMDEMLAVRCDAARAAVEAAWSYGKADVLTHACREMIQRFDAHDDRLMAMLTGRLPIGDQRERICSVVAGNLEFTAGAMEAAGDRWGTLTALSKALKAAEGTALEVRIRAKHDKLHQELNWNSSFVFGKAFESPGPKPATQGKTVSMTVGTDGIVTTGDRLSTKTGQRKITGSKRAAEMITQGKTSATVQTANRLGWQKRVRQSARERHGKWYALVAFACLMLGITAGLVQLHQSVTQSSDSQRINFGDPRYGMPLPENAQSTWPFLPMEVSGSRPAGEPHMSLDAPSSLPGFNPPSPQNFPSTGPLSPRVQQMLDLTRKMLNEPPRPR